MKEDSIEETKKQLELILKVRKGQKEIIECAGGSCINCDPDIKALTESIDILSDYKRVLKENEILKEEKEQAWEEWNNLEQGSYKIEQKLKQQLKESQKENEELEEKVEKQEDIIKNALYIINKNEKEKVDRTWLYNFDKCVTLKGDNK